MENVRRRRNAFSGAFAAKLVSLGGYHLIREVRVKEAYPQSLFIALSATWVPFFDDVNAIIFLAPISSFDQTLVEDRSANRLVS